MIRVTTRTTPHGETVFVDGELAGEYVDVVECLVRQARGRASEVRLYLRDVTAIDECGRALLDRLAANGVHLLAEGVYWSYIVAEISRRHDVSCVA